MSKTSSGNIILYHGSRGGLDGEIRPCSRNRCDFGQGFYMYTDPKLAKELVRCDQMPVLYLLHIRSEDIKKTKVLNLSGLEWVYFVLYNRGKLEDVKETKFYRRFATLGQDCDFIVGSVADGIVNDRLKKFRDGIITDETLLQCMQRVSLYQCERTFETSMQYAAKTENACKILDVLFERDLPPEELEETIRLYNMQAQEEYVAVQNQQRPRDRQGLYFDEVLEKAKQNVDVSVLLNQKRGAT